MSRKTLNIILLAAITVTIGLNFAVGVDYNVPNDRFIPELVKSIPYDSYEPNPYFSDDRTLRIPPEGSIPVSNSPLHYNPTVEDAIRAGDDLTNPFPAESTGIVDEGAYLYRDYCFPCHGAKGTGDGPVSRRGFPAPPSLAGENALKMKDGRMFHLITFGQGNMPDYKSQLSREERWKVILHLRKLQERLLVELDVKSSE